jgi:hypothetical protein
VQDRLHLGLFELCELKVGLESAILMCNAK